MTERELFEAWFKRRVYPHTQQETEMMWQAWQAARAAVEWPGSYDAKGNPLGPHDNNDGVTVPHRMLFEALADRIRDYLTSGGLFNPELADHMLVRDLLLECRDALRQAARAAAPAEPVAKGDYVLATKWDDGDPGDHWGVGFYDGERGGRHYVVDGSGNQIRGNGFRRVGKITHAVGAWLLSVADSLERSPPGAVNLWGMLGAQAARAALLAHLKGDN